MSAMKIRAQALKELEDKFGRVTAETLVNAARDRRHPLHDDFIWDDKAAAHEHRIQTARQIINSVRCIVTTTTQRISSVSYVRDPNTQSGYVNVATLRTERDAAYEAMLAEVSRAQSILERAKEIAMALDLQSEFDDALNSMMSLSSRIRKGPSIPGEAMAAN